LSLESEVIFVDESGDHSLSDKSIQKCKYFVLGFVYCRSPNRLRKHLRRLLKRLHKKNKYPPKLDDLKFYLPTQKLFKKYDYSNEEVARYQSFMNKNRIKMIKILNRNCNGIYAAICDKALAGRDKFKNGEELGNWLFANTLTKNIIPYLRCRHTPSVIYDKGRLSASRCAAFHIYLFDIENYLRMTGINYDSVKLGQAQDCSSYTEPGIWASDIVAGAYRYAYVNSDIKYSQLLVNKIYDGHRLYWQK